MLPGYAAMMNDNYVVIMPEENPSVEEIFDFAAHRPGYNRPLNDAGTAFRFEPDGSLRPSGVVRVWDRGVTQLFTRRQLEVYLGARPRVTT